MSVRARERARFPAARLAVLWLGALLLSGCVPVEEPPPTGGDSGIDGYVELARVSQNIVGLGLGVIADGEVYLSGFGWADREGQVPFLPDVTTSRWASVSKTVTGTAAMILVEDGILDLDQDVSELYPAYVAPTEYLDGALTPTYPLPAPAVITLRKLLSHTAGIQHYWPDGQAPTTPPTTQIDDPAVNTGFVWALDRWTAAPFVNVPGTAYHYSTFGPNLAGAVIGQAYSDALSLGLPADRAFEQLVEDRIIAPSGATGLVPDRHWVDDPDQAVGYVSWNATSPSQDADHDVSWKLPGGGYKSTAADLLAYCDGMMGPSVVSQATKDAMWAAQPLDGGGTVNQGIGWDIGTRNGNARVMHNGEQEGATSRIVFYPDDGICVAILANTRDPENLTGLSLTTIANGVEDRVRLRLGAGEPPFQIDP